MDMHSYYKRSPRVCANLALQVQQCGKIFCELVSFHLKPGMSLSEVMLFKFILMLAGIGGRYINTCILDEKHIFYFRRRCKMKLGDIFKFPSCPPGGFCSSFEIGSSTRGPGASGSSAVYLSCSWNCALPNRDAGCCSWNV